MALWERCLALFAAALVVPSAQAWSGGERIDATVGKLTAIRNDILTVGKGRSAKRFRVDEETKIWRGDDVDLSRLRIGDDLSVRFRMPNPTGGAATLPVALDVEANIDRWNGMITKVAGDLIEISMRDESCRPLGRKAKIVFWSKTDFLVVGASRSDLRVGAYLEVIRLVTARHSMRAWRVIGFDSPPGPAACPRR